MDEKINPEETKDKKIRKGRVKKDAKKKIYKQIELVSLLKSGLQEIRQTMKEGQILNVTNFASQVFMGNNSNPHVNTVKGKWTEWSIASEEWKHWKAIPDPVDGEIKQIQLLKSTESLEERIKNIEKNQKVMINLIQGLKK